MTWIAEGIQWLLEAITSHEQTLRLLGSGGGYRKTVVHFISSVKEMNQDIHERGKNAHEDEFEVWPWIVVGLCFVAFAVVFRAFIY